MRGVATCLLVGVAACAAPQEGGPQAPAQRDALLDLAVQTLDCQALGIQLVSVTLDHRLQKAEGCGRVQLFEWQNGAWVPRSPEDTRSGIKDWAQERQRQERCRTATDRGSDPMGTLPVPPECEPSAP